MQVQNRAPRLAPRCSHPFSGSACDRDVFHRNIVRRFEGDFFHALTTLFKRDVRTSWESFFPQNPLQLYNFWSSHKSFPPYDILFAVAAKRSRWWSASPKVCTIVVRRRKV